MATDRLTEARVAEEVEAAVRAQLTADAAAELTAELDLRTSGIIDSFALIEVVAALEARFACEFSIDALRPERLRSVAGLTRLVLTTLRAGDGSPQR